MTYPIAPSSRGITSSPGARAGERDGNINEGPPGASALQRTRGNRRAPGENFAFCKKNNLSARGR